MLFLAEAFDSRHDRIMDVQSKLDLLLDCRGHGCRDRDTRCLWECSILGCKFLSLMLTLLIAGVYIIVRTYVIVEVFLSLRALPPSAFASIKWSSFVPHI